MMVVLALALVGLVAWYFLRQPAIGAPKTSAQAGVDLSKVDSSDHPIIAHALVTDPSTQPPPAPVGQVEQQGQTADEIYQMHLAQNLGAASLGASNAASLAANAYYASLDHAASGGGVVSTGDPTRTGYEAGMAEAARKRSVNQ